MSIPKETMIKEILSMRRRLRKVPTNETREIELFEEQITKSLRRADQISYLVKKFDRKELESIREAYSSL